MKYSFILFALFGLAACSSDSAQTNADNDPYLISDEVFKMTLGEEEVYGVRLKMTSPEHRNYLSYAVSLSQNENVWMDTIYTEVRPGDTVENELIFSEARVNSDDLVEVKAEAISIE